MKVPGKREDITLDWLNGIFKGRGLKVHGFSFIGDASHDRGFMGTLEQVDLQVSRLDHNSLGDQTKDSSSSGSSPDTLPIILKTLPNDPFRKSYAANDGFSTREVSMYTEVFKAWDEFLDHRQVPLASRFQYPKCYHGAEEGEGDTYKYILVLENLTAKRTTLSSSAEASQFQLWGPGFTEPLPWLAATAVIRQIARFHATGIAYKIENHVDCYYPVFPKLRHIVSPTFQWMWDNGFQITREVIEKVVEPDQIPDGLFEQFKRLQGDEGRDLLLKWFASPAMVLGERNTICHHDLHSNNLVLSGDQSEAVLFDFQASCVMNPMKDLTFFMILNCGLEDQTENLSQALQVYHDEFAKAMAAYKVDFKYSMEEIKRDYDWYLVFSLTHIMTGAMVWITGKDSTEVSKKRFATAVINAYNKGILSFPTHEP